MNWLAGAVALLKAIFEVLRIWQKKKQDDQVREEVQDDIRIRDQAAAIRIHRDADSVRDESAAGDATEAKRERLGRRESGSDGSVP